MHNVVSNGHFMAIFVENSEKTHAVWCGMIIEQTSILWVLMLVVTVLLEVVWLSCKLKSPR
ncbi:hypothetical protein CF120_15640 [Aeromonas allosaccharophila]|nr:hypothetical protein BSP75_04380 [Aeromonas sp. YN13HZO-058]TNI88570.1 hypothetical protein CF120_15640 [Aeromonas allosaccharophila]